MHLVLPFLASVLGYFVSHLISSPKSKINKKLPLIKIKGVEFMPSIKVTVRGRIIHFHHWFNFTIILCISVFVTSAVLDSWLTRGFLMGGVLQGLRFSDRAVIKKIGK